jgi:hypothetical protein
MFTVTYPISESEETLLVQLGDVEPDPHPDGGDFRVSVELTGPQLEIDTYVYGIDALQCIWLALNFIKGEITAFEQATGFHCEYTGFVGSEHFETQLPTAEI